MYAGNKRDTMFPTFTLFSNVTDWFKPSSYILCTGCYKRFSIGSHPLLQFIKLFNIVFFLMGTFHKPLTARYFLFILL